VRKRTISDSMSTFWRHAQVMAACAVCLLGCGAKNDEEAAAYAKLEGLYELTSIQRFAGACDDSGDATTLNAIPNLWVVYVVENGVPDTQLHAHGCSSAEHCRQQAADVQADGSPDYATDFARYVYSRFSADGTIDGVGVDLIGVVDGKCRLELEQSSVHRDGDLATFSARYRAGAQYAPEPDGSCAPRPDLAHEWQSWTNNECSRFDVVSASFKEAL
jgi:hypothetical protein